MKMKFLVISIAMFLSPLTFAEDSVEAVKNRAPNEYDCTIDELELHITKRTENLRKESTLSSWEDFKTTAQQAKLNGGGTSSQQASNSSANGDAQAEALAQAQTGGSTGEEEDDCPLFFEDLEDIDTDSFEMPDLGSLFSNGLSDLDAFVTEQVSQLTTSLMNVVKAGVCERLSTEYLTDLATDVLDDQLDEEIGYTTDDITGGSFANEVINDQLKAEYGTSNAKLLNIMDDDLNDKRESFMGKQLDNQLDSVEDEMIK